MFVCMTRASIILTPNPIGLIFETNIKRKEKNSTKLRYLTNVNICVLCAKMNDDIQYKKKSFT